MKHICSIRDLQAVVFNALAHPARLEILELLRGGEACVCQIQARLGKRQAYVSQHLMALRQAGLVASRKEGSRMFYRISAPAILSALDAAQTVVLEQGKLKI